MNRPKYDKTIVHITFDFPDFTKSNETRAVYNLVNANKDYKNVIFSLTRTANPFENFKVHVEEGVYIMRTYGFPYGIGLNLWMFLVYKRIVKILEKESIDVNLIHAHKLTFEGIIAKYISLAYDVPYILTVRGDTDIKLLKYLKHIRWLYKNIIEGAKHVIILAPWTKEVLCHYFDRKLIEDKITLIPNIIELEEQELNVQPKYNNRFVSVFHLNSYKRKNIKKTIQAIDLLHETTPEIELDIIGGGETRAIIEAYIERCKYPNRFRMLGFKTHKEVLNSYKDYIGLILPSYPETFGLVYIEALNSGIPVIYSKNSGIDGYFTEDNILESVDPKSVEDISKAIFKIFKNYPIYQKAIRRVKEIDGFNRFRAVEVGKVYKKIIDNTIRSEIRI